MAASRKKLICIKQANQFNNTKNDNKIKKANGVFGSSDLYGYNGGKSIKYREFCCCYYY